MGVGVGVQSRQHVLTTQHKNVYINKRKQWPYHFYISLFSVAIQMEFCRDMDSLVRLFFVLFSGNFFSCTSTSSSQCGI